MKLIQFHQCVCVCVCFIFIVGLRTNLYQFQFRFFAFSFIFSLLNMLFTISAVQSNYPSITLYIYINEIYAKIVCVSIDLSCPYRFHFFHHIMFFSFVWLFFCVYYMCLFGCVLFSLFLFFFFTLMWASIWVCFFIHFNYNIQ